MKYIPILMVMLLSIAVEVLARDPELVGRWETRTEEDAGILSGIMSLGQDGAYKLELFAPDESIGALHNTIEILDGMVFTGQWDTADSLLVIHIEVTPDLAMFFGFGGSRSADGSHRRGSQSGGIGGNVGPGRGRHAKLH